MHRFTLFVMLALLSTMFIVLSGQSTCDDHPQCLGQPVGTICDIGSQGTQDGLCDGVGNCFLNLCLGTPPPDCDDQNQCTDDATCDPFNGCAPSTPSSVGSVCDLNGVGDGACDGAGNCLANLCLGPPPVVCNDNNQCTVDLACDPLDGSCSTVPEPAGFACDLVGSADGQCDGAGTCVECLLDLDCSQDGNKCTVATCQNNSCATQDLAAAAFCDLNGIDDGLCDGQGGCIVGEGRLGIDSFSFDTDNYFQVTLKNFSTTQTVPADQGDLRVFVDGQLAADIQLETLPSQVYQQTSSSQVVTFTGFRFSGTNRRVAVLLDTDRELVQFVSDEKELLRAITPPAISGADLVITDLVVDSNDMLLVKIENSGDIATAQMTATINVAVDGVPASVGPTTLPPLSVGQSVLVAPSPTVTITGSARVLAGVEAPTPLDEIDTLNNSRTETLPTEPDPTSLGYTALLSTISDELKWETMNHAILPYAQWSQEMIDDLFADISELESGNYTDPPLPNATGAILEEDVAWAMFTRHVAHSLWVENNALVPWSFVQFSVDERELLFDSHNWYSVGGSGYSTIGGGGGFAQRGLGQVTSWNPSANYEFLRNLNLIGSTHEETVFAVVDWSTRRVRHASPIDYPNGNHFDYLHTWGFAGAPLLERILYPFDNDHVSSPIDHVVAGCHSAAGMYAGILRSINVPARYIGSNETGNWRIHGRIDFPTIQRTNLHADDTYGERFFGTGQPGPARIRDLLLTYAEADSLLFNPTLDCNGGSCNDLYQQSTRNNHQHQKGQCLDAFCTKLVNAYLSGPDKLKTQLLNNLEPYSSYPVPPFTDAEVTARIAEIEAYFLTLGDGDRALGIINYGKRGNHPN